MESKQNLYYCHLTTDEDNLIKGEFNKQISKFIFYVMKYKGDNKIEIKIPLNMKQFKFDVCLEINFRNCSVILRSNDKKYSKLNKMNSVKLAWNIAHCKKSEVFSEENRKYLISIYDQFDYHKLIEIKRPIRIIIKQGIFSKILMVNSFFEELRKKQIDFILNVEESFRSLKESMDKKIKFCHSHEPQEEISSLENLSLVLTDELFKRINEIKKFINRTWNFVP